MFKSRHVYLCKILLIYISWLVVINNGDSTLVAVESVESVKQKLTFEFYHELTYITQ